MRIKKFLPLILIALFMVLAYLFGLNEYLTFETLKKNRDLLNDIVASHPFTAPLIYMLVYMTLTALSFPGAVFLSLGGGFLFPQPFSTIYVVMGATLGASIIFLAAKSALGEALKNRAGPFLQKMQKGFQDDAASYMLFLRLVPIFPFWLVNLAPAFFGVNLFTFIWTTFVGIIPGAFVFTQAGVGFGAIIDQGAELTIDTIFNNQIKIALVALGLFAILPILIKLFWRKK